MIDTRRTDTRERILVAARELFLRQGAQATSIREIAERVGLTKTAVLYHFTTKAEILSALATPLFEDLEAVVAETPDPPDEAARWALIESLVDVYLKHRAVLSLALSNFHILASDVGYPRFVKAMTRANALAAGQSPDLADRVRAAQAVAALSDPVILLKDEPVEELRRHVLAGARRLLDYSGPVGRPRRTGRPPVVDESVLDRARRMQAAGTHTMAQIAEAVGVSRATLYRHLG